MLARSLKVVSHFSAGMAVVAGAVGAVAVWRLGPALAMGLAIYTLRTTEPAMPAMDYPWGVHGLCLALCGGALLWARRAPGVAPEILLHVGAMASALVPFLGLVQLWSQT